MDLGYIAGFCDGDGSIFISKCNHGFQLIAKITQCNIAILERLNKEVFNYRGGITTDRRDKYNNEPASNLCFSGKHTSSLLTIMSKHGVIKEYQANVAFDFLADTRRCKEKEDLYLKMKEANADKSSYPKKYERITDGYIAGLFDAEGNVYDAISKNGKHAYYVKITQKCDPGVITAIKNYLGFGKISKSESYRIRFYSKSDIIAFHNIVDKYIIIKKQELNTLVQKLM